MAETDVRRGPGDALPRPGGARWRWSGWLAPAIPGVVVGGGIDIPAAGDPERFRRETGIGGEFMVCVGRIDPGKNTHQLAAYFDAWVRRRGGAREAGADRRGRNAPAGGRFGGQPRATPGAGPERRLRRGGRPLPAVGQRELLAGDHGSLAAGDAGVGQRPLRGHPRALPPERRRALVRGLPPVRRGCRTAAGQPGCAGAISAVPAGVTCSTTTAGTRSSNGPSGPSRNSRDAGSGGRCPLKKGLDERDSMSNNVHRSPWLSTDGGS